MAKVYKKREYVNYPPTEPIHKVARCKGREWVRGNSMIIYTPDFEPFEAIIGEPLQHGIESIAYVSFRSIIIDNQTAWINLTITPKVSLSSICHLEHNRLRIHFPFPRPGKSKHLFDIVEYGNVIVTENEARVSGVKVQILQSVVEKKVFNPKQLKLF